MKFRFPLDDVKIEIATEKKVVKSPLFDDGFFRVNQHELSVDIKDVAGLFISNGKDISVTPAAGSGVSGIETVLNNWGLVGILHQRKLLNFHASAVEINGRGIMICGDSGAGKSSLTAALCNTGARFLSDDVTVITFNDGNPTILPLENRLALRNETLLQLQSNGTPAGVNPVSNKHLFQFPLNKKPVPLGQVLRIVVHDGRETMFEMLSGTEKFSMLRGEICAWEMLKGMPETEIAYLNQLVGISVCTPVTQVKRPHDLTIGGFVKNVEALLLEQSIKQN